MSVTRLAELYIFDALLRDGYSDRLPVQSGLLARVGCGGFATSRSVSSCWSLSIGSESTEESCC